MPASSRCCTFEMASLPFRLPLAFGMKIRCRLAAAAPLNQRASAVSRLTTLLFQRLSVTAPQLPCQPVPLLPFMPLQTLLQLTPNGSKSAWPASTSHSPFRTARRARATPPPQARVAYFDHLLPPSGARAVALWPSSCDPQLEQPSASCVQPSRAAP